jgi:soluble lytic murein transglycosylase
MELALSLSWSRRPEAVDYFAKSNIAQFDERAFEWHARAALWAGNWKLVGDVIASMPDSLSKQTRWRYWRARALEAQGKRTEAQEAYATNLTDDNYFAALSAARLGRRYTPQQQSLTFDDAQLALLLQDSALVRTRELLATNVPTLRASAYEEWRAAYVKWDAMTRRQSVALAARWKWFDQAVTLAAQQGLFNDYELFYPRPFNPEVDNAAELTAIPASLIYATMRQESLYRTDAQSIAGAKGLMQLLPETAQRIARRWKLKTGDLFDPSVNIPIGSAKLRDMIDRFGGLVPLALAGYNAGPNTVPRWLPAQAKDSDVWIENIPYNETRTYIQRIHWYSLVFEWLSSKQPQDAAQWLTRIEPAK